MTRLRIAAGSTPWARQLARSACAQPSVCANASLTSPVVPHAREGQPAGSFPTSSDSAIFVCQPPRMTTSAAATRPARTSHRVASTDVRGPSAGEDGMMVLDVTLRTLAARCSNTAMRRPSRSDRARRASRLEPGALPVRGRPNACPVPVRRRHHLADPGTARRALSGCCFDHKRSSVRHLRRRGGFV